MAATAISDKIGSHRDFWSRRTGTGPFIKRTRYGTLSKMQIHLADGAMAGEGTWLRPEQLDATRLAYLERPTASTTMIIATTQEDTVAGDEAGDTFAIVAPVQRVPWTEAILGCPIGVGIESMWSEPCLDSPADIGSIRSWRDSPWLAKLLEITGALVDRFAPPVMVTQTLMRGPVDMLAALLGDERTVYALADSPDLCDRLLQVSTEAFIGTGHAQYDLVPRVEGGHCSWFGIWAPGTVIRTQCDASALIGPAWYEQHILPYDIQISEAFDYSVIHLHSEFLHTVDAILKHSLPTAIQVAIDPGGFGPPPNSLIPVFRKILEKKPLLIEGRLTEREFDAILAALPGEGLFVNAAIAEEGSPP